MGAAAGHFSRPDNVDRMHCSPLAVRQHPVVILHRSIPYLVPLSVNNSHVRFHSVLPTFRDSLRAMQGAIDGGAFRVTGSVYDGLPDLPTILLTALEVARALEYLHGKNILHGARASGV